MRTQCANNWLLDTVARKEWGFDGYITSVRPRTALNDASTIAR
eukprot:COSAG01_NODE_5842_length_4001_cov_13.893388_7_plen_43_part_00